MQEPEVRARTTLEASVVPSEDPAKVSAALAAIAGEGSGPGMYDGRKVKLVTEDPTALGRIRDQLRDRHVRSAARRQMLLNRKGATTSLMLNRQAAAVGVLALCGAPEESPLGPIYLTIESRRLEGVIDWMTAYAE